MSRRAVCRSASLCLLTSLAATTVHATNYARGYFVDNVLLPTTSSEASSYAIDVDGNGSPDNSFGQVLAALVGTGFDLTGTMGAAVASGSIVHLVHLQSIDAAFKNDPAAQATWCIGVPTPTPPLFDGTDNASCADTSGTFVAALSSGSFTSAAPATNPNPVFLDIEIAVRTSSMTLNVQNARLSFTTNGAGDITFGQINGMIPHEDLLNTFPPTIAIACNDSIENDPAADFSSTCKGIFDKGCSATPSFSGDGLIEVCEVTESSLMQSLLAPDVQIVDNGSTIYFNSLGIRFTAIAIDRVFASGFEP